MIRTGALAVVAGWLGATLLLGELRWFRRPALLDRLAPYLAGGRALGRRGGVLSVQSLREVIGPLAQAIGDRTSRLFGVTEDLAVRLARAHSPFTVAAFRLRQLGAGLGALAAATLLDIVVGPPPVIALGALLILPLLAFLVLEQQVVRASDLWRRQVFLELPIVAEQLAMLLGAGYSLGSALNRLSRRSGGACATDLTGVAARMRQGLTDVEALREWAELVRVDALDRLVGVLALHREAGDLGRLITEEARTIRRDAHRELIEHIERRGQQVWVPVTVAALVPGVLFMVVPFIEAMRLFTSG